MGGIVCESCNPPRNGEADVVTRLVVEAGVWIDPADRFELGESAPAAAVESPAHAPRGVPAATSPAAGRVGSAVVPSGGARSSNATVRVPVSGRGPAGEFSLAEFDLFGRASIWAPGAGPDLTVVDGRVRWQGKRAGAAAGEG